MLDTFTQIFLAYTSERLAVWDLVQKARHCVRSPSTACPVSKISSEGCLFAQVTAPWREGAAWLCSHWPQLKAARQTLLQVHEVSAPECVCRVSVSEISFLIRKLYEANLTAEQIQQLSIFLCKVQPPTCC